MKNEKKINCYRSYGCKHLRGASDDYDSYLWCDVNENPYFYQDNEDKNKACPKHAPEK